MCKIADYRKDEKHRNGNNLAYFVGACFNTITVHKQCIVVRKTVIKSKIRNTIILLLYTFLISLFELNILGVDWRCYRRYGYFEIKQNKIYSLFSLLEI